MTLDLLKIIRCKSWKAASWEGFMCLPFKSNLDSPFLVFYGSTIISKDNRNYVAICFGTMEFSICFFVIIIGEFTFAEITESQKTLPLLSKHYF